MRLRNRPIAVLLFVTLALSSCTVEVEDRTGPLSYSPPANLQNIEVRVRSNTTVSSVALEMPGALPRPMARVSGSMEDYALTVAVNACQGVLTYKVEVDGPRIRPRRFPQVGSFSQGISGRPADCIGVPGPFSRIFVADRHHDFPDSNVGDGYCRGTDIDGTQGCSLRAAVMEANALEGHDLIRVSPEKHFFNGYTTGSEGLTELDDSIADLDITDDLTIEPTSVSNRSALEILAGPYFYDDVPNGETAKIDAVNGFAFPFEPWQRVFQVAPGATLLLRHVEVARGAGAKGGGILNQGRLLLDHVILVNNSASNSSGRGEGGGIYNEGALYITDSVIVGNHSDRGGGLYLETPATVERSVIGGNRADLGAAIRSEANFSITNSTIFGNDGSSVVHVTNARSPEMGYVTWAENLLDAGDRQFSGTYGGIAVRNSLFVDNTGSWGSAIRSLGGNVSDGAPVITRDTPLLPDFFHESIDVDVDLTDQGGFVPAPQLLSEPTAIGAIAGRGNVPPVPFTDIRGSGYPRPKDRAGVQTGPADSGAVEYRAP